MLYVLLCVIIGFAVGYLLRRRPTVLCALPRTTSLTVFALLFVMGYTCGHNPELMSRFGDLGWQALLIAVAASLAGALAAMGVYRLGMKGKEKTDA